MDTRSLSSIHSDRIQTKMQASPVAIACLRLISKLLVVLLLLFWLFVFTHAFLHAILLTVIRLTGFSVPDYGQLPLGRFVVLAVFEGCLCYLLLQLLRALQHDALDRFTLHMQLLYVVCVVAICVYPVTWSAPDELGIFVAIAAASLLPLGYLFLLVKLSCQELNNTHGT